MLHPSVPSHYLHTPARVHYNIFIIYTRRPGHPVIPVIPVIPVGQGGVCGTGHPVIPVIPVGVC